MSITFVYKGRYHIRDANIIEQLSSIAKTYGYETHLAYDEDVLGVTDNVIANPLLNKFFSNNNRTVKKIIQKNPEIIVFLEGFTRSKWNKEISKNIQKLKDAKRILLTHRDSDGMLEAYDYILVGEPEFAFERFLAEKIYNKERGAYVLKGLSDLNALPLADKGLFSPYVNFRDSYLIYTSKGCPYHCSYCEETIYKQCFGSHYFRRRDPGVVIRELEEAKSRFDMREVIYKDSVFTWDKEWLRGYLKEYTKRINVPYKCFAKAENFDEELAGMLKESGCYCVEFGVQTFNQRLKNDILKRSETNDTLLRAFELCDACGLRYDADHLFGIPGESVQDHIEAARQYLGLRYLNRIKCHNLTFYKEAEIYEQVPSAIKNNATGSADFFSSISGEESMISINKTFQKYFKLLPLIPKPINCIILKRGNWRIMRLMPHFLVVFCMSLIALKHQDKRFFIYLKYYPRHIINAFMRKWII